jgi:hypothetical protein
LAHDHTHRPEDIAAAIAAYSLTFSTFGIEISVPPSIAVREHSLHAHVCAMYGSSGVMTPWNPGDIILLKSVARCVANRDFSLFLAVCGTP